MKIIKADQSYLEQIMGLYKELFCEMAELDCVRFRSGEQNEEFILNILFSDDADVLLAKKDDEIVGLALVLEDETPDYNCLVKRKTAVLMNITVNRNFRKMGVGKMLLEASKDWARKHNAEFLQLNVVAKNKNAIKFYKRYGLEDTMITMECKL